MRIRARYLIVALLIVPLADAALLLWVATNLLTAVQTVALVVLTGLLGMLLVRAEGRHTIRALQRKAASGEVPTGELLDGALLVAAGAFLLTPGLVTDLLGFVLAVPPTRYPIREALRRYVVVPYLDEKTGGIYTGAVWTGGFPDPDDVRDGARFGAGANATGGTTAGSANSSGSAGAAGPAGSSGASDASGTADASTASTDRARDDDYVDVEFEEVDEREAGDDDGESERDRGR